MPTRPAPRVTFLALLLAGLIAGTLAPAPAGPAHAVAAEPTPTTEPTPAADPTATPAADPTATPTATPDATPDPSPTPTPEPTATAAPTPSPTPTAAPTPSPTPTASPTPSPTSPPSDSLRLRRLPVIRGSISPKSIVATGTGLFFAQNMMYRHTMTVYNRKGQLVKTISDRVNLSRFGFDRWPSRVNGAPVEAAVAPDHKHIYVSQYSMYGPGFNHPGWDTGWVDDRIDRSFVYEISLSTFRKTRVFRVGPVPKAVGVSPDGRWLLAANWTHRDVSLVDLRKGREVKRIVVGGNPRGIAFAPDSSKVYLSAESGQRVLVYTFATGNAQDADPVSQR